MTSNAANQLITAKLRWDLRFEQQAMVTNGLSPNVMVFNGARRSCCSQPPDASLSASRCQLSLRRSLDMGMCLKQSSGSVRSLIV